MIEKRITHQLLETGVLPLTDLECAALTLPEHSSTVAMELESEAFHAQWSGRTKQLTGDKLTELLQDYGQDGGLFRLRLVADVYRLSLLPPGTPATFTKVTLPPIVARKPNAARATRRRATIDRQFHADNEYDWGKGANKSIGFLTAARSLMGDQLKVAGFDPLELVELRLQGEELATLDDFEELLAVDVSNVDRMPHQEAVARHALSRLRGRAVLADEVGLGKTIEAGLAMKELALRGLAKRILILCPAPLRDQWREEMHSKFDLAFEVAYGGPQIKQQDMLILSLTLARSNIAKLSKTPWDIVVVDEAHRAAGGGAVKTRDLITSLTTACRYAFFLTATPVQNDLLELYRLVELLRPGTFESVNAFKRQFMVSYDPRTPNDPAALRRLISSVMIRTTRAQAGVDRVVRKAVDVPIDLGPRERELYALSTDLLRNVMQDSGDTMRRRSLALRLTASPFSMGTTALRMAERHPDPKVRSVLGEIGHLAMDIKESARENKALELTKGWLRDHGRVLIFTQHTDTVTGLLRRMEAEGIKARSFHGSMSPGERAKTIAAFRSGDAPVMISTDAGAEGQNLQFCNCVLNFDLPWNPMRIEQRIGRVDRLTQPKDEVFVANLYARGTIDESVYQLLAKKLRMFELLFGQVTTILGELDESKSATFETRVLEALFADNDSKMQGLLTQLGSELVNARERASTLIAADSGMSNWMAEAFEHRKGLTKAGSSDLAPAVSERSRMRQRRVQAWVRSVLKALDVQIIHDTGEGDGAFLTAQFDDEFEQELGGRTLVHLAFDRFGLDHHPDAELCAVGSPVFDELLGLLRMRGDLHVTVPVIPEDAGPSPYAHAPNLRLVSRRLVPSGSWSGQATFRATVGEAETTEHLITAEVNGHNEQRLKRRPLAEGESMSTAFGQPSKVVADFERAATSQLESLRREREKLVKTEQSRELDRITGGYTAQIAEAQTDDKQRLRRALKSEERRLNREPDIRARAKALALTLDEDDWIVEETWAGPGGSGGKFTYEWGLTEPVDVESDASAEVIRVLALCSESHWVDASETTHCASCDGELCAACGEGAVFADCPICGTPSCGYCREETGGTCLTCATPTRTPELDSKYAIAWRFNAGTTLRVGQRVAELIRNDQAPALLVLDDDVDNQQLARIRSYAANNNLPMDCGLSLRVLTRNSESENSSRARLTTTSAVDIELSVIDSDQLSIDAAAATDLPSYPNVHVLPEKAFRLGEVLQRLREQAAPPSPPTIQVTHRSKFVDVYLESDRLAEEVSQVSDDGTLVLHHTRSVELHWNQTSTEDDLLAKAELGNLSISVLRRNEAVLIRGLAAGHEATTSWIACPPGAEVPDQLGAFGFLQSIGNAGGRLGKRANEVLNITNPFPSPSECELVERRIEQISDFCDIKPGIGINPVDNESLTVLGIQPDYQSAKRISILPSSLNEAFLTRTGRSFTAAVRNGLRVRESWKGRGTAVHEYEIFDGEPLAPTLDDLGIRDENFGVCRDGHFYQAGTAGLCASCQSWSCRACDGIGHQASLDCQNCSASVCRRCVSGTHQVSRTSCVLCTDHACSGCGRDPQVAACAICERKMCASCRSGELCPGCSQLAPVSSEGLPEALAAEGATLLAGADADGKTVLINRGDIIEQAIIRGQSVDRWIVFGVNQIDASYHLRLSVSRLLHHQVIPLIEPLKPDLPLKVPHLTLESERSYRASWAVPRLEAAGRSVSAFATPDGNLAALIATGFPENELIPQAGPTASARITSALANAGKPPRIEMVMRWERYGHDLALTRDGTVRRTIEDSQIQEVTSPWERQIDWVVPWVVDQWEPSPTVRAYVAGRDIEAAIVSLASLYVLGVRINGKSDWYIITASPTAPAATILSRSMGLGDTDEVEVFTDPKKVTLSAVTNATHRTLNVKPLGTVSIGPRSRTDVTAQALAAWKPHARVIQPTFRVFNDDVRLALENLIRPAPPRTKLEIGSQVEELVTVDDGLEWSYAARLAAGQTHLRRIDDTTRKSLDSGVIDREGHFGAGGTQCYGCLGRICAVCTDGMVPCDCCGISICKRCIGEPVENLWLCPACMSTRPPTRGEAREHGRLLSKRNMLVGGDAAHTVVVEHSKNHWTRRAPDGEKHVIANPSVNKFFDDRLAQGSDELSER